MCMKYVNTLPCKDSKRTQFENLMGSHGKRTTNRKYFKVRITKLIYIFLKEYNLYKSFFDIHFKADLEIVVFNCTINVLRNHYYSL